MLSPTAAEPVAVLVDTRGNERCRPWRGGDIVFDWLRARYPSVAFREVRFADNVPHKRTVWIVPYEGDPRPTDEEITRVLGACGDATHMLLYANDLPWIDLSSWAAVRSFRDVSAKTLVLRTSSRTDAPIGGKLLDVDKLDAFLSQ